MYHTVYPVKRFSESQNTGNHFGKDALKGLFNDYAFSVHTEPSTAQEYSLLQAFFLVFDPCVRYCRFNSLTDRSKIVHQQQ